MNKKLIILNLVTVLALIFLSPISALALGLGDSSKFLNEVASNSGFDVSDGKENIEPIIASIVKSLLSFLGVIFFLLVIYGGFMWMTAQGSEDQIGKAKKIIINSTVGLVVIMLAYAITWFIIYQLTESTGFQQG